jgi:hypothetical protein
MMVNQDTLPWLLKGPPWIVYRTRIDLMGEPDDAPEVMTARQLMVSHPKIVSLIRELQDWPGYPLKRHNDANHPIHKLAFLADLGLDQHDPGLNTVIRRILANQAPEGPLQVVMNINPRYGGKGEDQLVWMLCDAPVVLYSLVKFGLEGHPQVQGAIEYLTGLIRENGWPCAVMSDIGKFRGPGRKGDPCPYANLVMLKLMALIPDYRASPASQIGTKILLDLWSQRKHQRPYLFAMGTHFSYLKAPLIWYDILHVLDVLSQFPWILEDIRFCEMMNILDSKTDESGRFTAESAWMAWKDWEFGQKKEPSYWLTLISQRIKYRVQESIRKGL